jgi:hypothetical protein
MKNLIEESKIILSDDTYSEAEDGTKTFYPQRIKVRFSIENKNFSYSIQRVPEGIKYRTNSIIISTTITKNGSEYESAHIVKLYESAEKFDSAISRIEKKYNKNK